MVQLARLCSYLLKLLIFSSLVNNFEWVPSYVAGVQNVYKPIRIHPYYSNLNYELNDSEADILKNSVDNIILYLKQLLLVFPNKSPLLLGRDACKSSWTNGRNKGKCSQIKKDYSGEICDDNFLIPDKHLEAFYTWTHEPLPDKTWYTDGVGISNADYILYIQAMSTNPCLTNFHRTNVNRVTAYASYCKLGEMDRPVAGYVNFCPSEFRESKNDQKRLRLTVLHEIFHALGFSKDLFLRYRDCSMTSESNENCAVWGYPILRQHGANYLLLTPTVVKAMQDHFTCNKTEFGAPLMTINGVLQSHWDSNILHGSIMSHTLENPEHIFVDPVTLAAMQDTGWYKVNFSYTDSYPYAKGSGCDYVTGTTEHSSQSCSFPHVRSTCDSWYSTKIINCTISAENNPSVICDSGTSDRTEITRCLQEVTSMSSYGKCYTVQCLGQNQVWVKVSENNWLLCPEKGVIELKYADVKIHCPRNVHLFCYKRGPQLYLEDLVSLQTTTTTPSSRVVTHDLKNMYSFTSGIGRADDIFGNNSRSGFHHVYGFDFTLMCFTIISWNINL